VKKKIILIINNLGVGGAERLVIDDAHELVRRGWEVMILTLKREKGASLKDILLPNQVTWMTIPFGGLCDIVSWRRLIATIKHFQPQAVCTHLWLANTIGRVAACVVRVPTIISFEHGFSGQSGNWKVFLIDRVLQYLSTKIVAVSQATQEMIIARGIKRHKVIVIPNGINLDLYRLAQPAAIRAELGLSKDAFIFLSVGSLRSKQKNMDVVIQASARLKLNAVLLIAGAGVEMSYLQQVARGSEVADKVHFLGSRQDIPRLLKAADCFVLLSRFEGLPLVVIEALAAARPIIVSDFDSAKEVIQDGVNGVIVPRGNIAASADQMQKIVLNKDQREALARAAGKSAQEFSISRHVDQLMRLIK
jgi:glycosyltransferase involved in cell wall biosynthesis